MEKITVKNSLNSFENFTNLYELSKTLRFELKPVGNTQKMLDENKVFEKDKLIDDNYHKIKYYFDLLHRKFIKESLLKIDFDFNEYYKSFLVLKKGDKKTQDDFKKQEDNLRKNLVGSFNEKANEWKENYKQKGIELKQAGFEIFFEKDNLEILKEEFKNKPNSDEKAPDIEFIDLITNESKNLFESFKGFTTYFNNFNNSRRNFYSSEAKDTAIANRAINENLRRFCDNKKLFDDNKKIYEKISLTEDEKKIFELNFYNNCLAQDGINKYNEIIGRKAKDEGSKGLNQKINEYKQKTEEKVRNFKMLDKQILGESDKDAEKFIEITKDEQVFELLNEFIKLNNKKTIQSEILFNNFLSNREIYDLDKIYLKKAAINTISRKIFGDKWQYFENALPKRETDSKEEKYKLDDFISIQIIKDALSGVQKDKKELPKKYQYLSKIEMPPKDLFKEEHKAKLAGDNYQSFLNVWKSEFEKCLDKYEKTKEQAEKMITEEKVYKKSDAQIEKIKAYADASLSIFQMMKYFALEKGRKKIVNLQTDDNFYNNFGEYYNDYNLNAYYNEFRNYLTKKPFSEEQIKLNFENGQVLSGWDINKETEYFGSLLKKENNYFLAIFHKNHSDEIFRKKVKNSTIKIEEAYNVFDNDFYEKVELKQIPKLFMNLPRICFARSNEKEFGLTDELKSIKKEFDIFQNNKKEKRDNNAKFNQEKFVKLLAYYKYCLEKREDWKVFEYNFKPLEQYENLGGFYRDIERNAYSFGLIKVNRDYVEKKNNEGKIYLFKIYGKDFSEQSLGNGNLHTLYFKMLFSASNIISKKIALSANAKVFFRNKTEEEKLKLKKDNQGKDVIDHKRYANDKIIFHLPIVLNFAEHNEKINQRVLNKFIFNENKFNDNINIIGIDRGENHLAYYSVIDQTGKIIESESLNKIYLKDKNGNPIFRKDEQDNMIDHIDYLKLLEAKAGNRDKARKNWKTIENIKELKNGYISQVVRKICDLILEYNAIVVFEDLSGGFKRNRMKIEQQVYQKLELALVKKLNYLANKNAKENEAGHFLKAYQLTSPVATYSDIGKQTGIIFYTQASYTSKTCPQCGFRKNVGFYFETKQKAENEIKKIKAFEYEPRKNRFKIEYNLSDFVKEEKKSRKERNNILFQEEKKKDNFVIYSSVVRYKWRDKKINKKDLGQGEKIYKTEKENRGTVLEYDITECLAGLFKLNSIDYLSEDTKDKIINQNLSAEFYKNLFYYLFLLSNTRNSVSGTDIDYIQCPQCGFDSRNNFQGHKFNGDANGAYNIARKGIMILEKIKQYKKENGSLDKISWGDLVIGIDEWDKFAQK